MKGLSKSLSASALSPAVGHGVAPGVSGSGPLLEGTLYVAKAADSNSPAAWEPYRFAHHTDGSVSFRPIKGKNQNLLSQHVDHGGLSGVQTRGPSDMFFLDADWRQPFVAAPWKPLSRSGARLQLPLPNSPINDAKDSTCGELFPFTLSYAPAGPKPGDADLTNSRRRTVVLAASTAQTRTRWLAALARKAHSPQLRSGAPVCPPGSISGPSSRQVAALGEEHIGLPVPGKAARNTSVPRLQKGPPSLFDSHSSLCIVRDLYDGYAADPLLHNSKSQHMISTDSDSSSAGQIQTSKARKSKFLAKYLDRQAEIEQLLNQKWSGGADSGNAPQGTSASILSRDAMSDSALCADDFVEDTALTSNGIVPEADAMDILLQKRLHVSDKTANITLRSNIVTNTQWSGGVMLSPPDEKSFRLTICPLDPLKDHPIFIGIAPPDADLSMVSFYSSGGGIFLCAGGQASDDLISALGAPGGPAFYCFGERHFTGLPSPKPGHYISLHYWQDKSGGHVRFFISTPEGEEVMSVSPPLEQDLPAGAWRPCLLLCMPDTRVHIVRCI